MGSGGSRNVWIWLCMLKNIFKIIKSNPCPTKSWWKLLWSSLWHLFSSSVERGHIIWSADVLFNPALYNRCKVLRWGTAHLWHFSPTKANSVQAANQSEHGLHNLIVALRLYIRIISGAVSALNCIFIVWGLLIGWVYSLSGKSSLKLSHFPCPALEDQHL